MINFQTFLPKYKIPYIAAGPNVAHGNVNIHCPFCGTQDPSFHLGIRLSDGAWGCWRDPLHRGRKPHRLLHALLGWSSIRVQAELGIDRTQIIEFSRTEQALRKKYPAIQRPKNFRIITDAQATRLQWNYLLNRGYHPDELSSLITAYRLSAAITGEWAKRVIIPVENLYGELETWVGRSISQSPHIRYKAVKKELAIPTTETLWLSPYIFSAQILCITEGPFDAITLDWYGRGLGFTAICIFGSVLSVRQEWLLRKISAGIELLVIALDRENLMGTLVLTKRLAGLPVFPMSMDVKDPGSMSREDVQEWIMNLHAKIGKI